MLGFSLLPYATRNKRGLYMVYSICSPGREFFLSGFFHTISIYTYQDPLCRSFLFYLYCEIFTLLMGQQLLLAPATQRGVNAMSLENLFAASFLASLTQADRRVFEALGEKGVRAHLNKLFTPPLPGGWTLSLESVTVVVNYNDRRWRTVPKNTSRRYFPLSYSLTPQHFPKGERCGKWEVTFRWLIYHRRPTTKQALEAIKATGFPGALRCEVESLIDAHPLHGWAGFGALDESGWAPLVFVYDDEGRRCFNLQSDLGDPAHSWSLDSRFPVVCAARPLARTVKKPT